LKATNVFVGTKALLALFVLILTLGASAAVALQSHDHEPSRDLNGVEDFSGDPDTVPGGGFCCLTGVAVDQSGGDLYFADATAPPSFSAGVVQRYDSGGAHLATFEVGETLSSPQDVAVDNSGTASDGTIYVADSDNNRVDALDSSGALVASFGDTEPATDGRLSGAETTPGFFGYPSAVAVEPVTGNLFVADQGHAKVWIFDSTGAYLGRIADSALDGPSGLAFSSDGGYLFVQNEYDGRVLIFGRQSATEFDGGTPIYAPDNGTPADPSDDGPFATDVAVDPASGHIYVDKGDRITEYDAGASPVSTFGQGTLCCSAGVAVDAGAGTVYASDGGMIRTFGPLFSTTPPVPTIDPVTDFDATSAHFTGTLDPQGTDTTYHFEYSTNHANWTSLATQGPLSGSGPQPVSDEATGLQPNRDYFARLVASNGFDDPVASSEESFHTDPAPPEVETGQAHRVDDYTVSVGGKVNPNNSPTTYWFEYGTADCATNPCTSVPAAENADAGSGGKTFAIGRFLENLSPETIYHYRLVAENAFGTSEGDDVTVTTQALAPSAGPARHYERVSPADKGNGDVVADGTSAVASRFGDAFAFNSRTPFGDTIGAGQAGQSVYVARRTDRGWFSHSITPTPRPDAQQTLFVPTRVQAYSDDLRSAVLWAYDLPAVSDDTPERTNIYVENTDTRELRSATVTQVDYPPFFEFFTNALWGISADARHLAFESSTRYLPDAAKGVPNVYQWDDGILSLVGILPDGSVPPTGSEELTLFDRTVMSADGSRMLFKASDGGNAQLYMRIDGDRTVQVSEPEPASGLSPDPSNVRFQAMTPDGRNVFFSVDTANGTDLYRYTDSADPENDGNLTSITGDGSFGGAEFFGSSNSGDQIYYRTGGNDLFVWDAGTRELIVKNLPLENSARVTPDGKYMMFVGRFVNGVDSLGNVTNDHREMYVYDLADHTLRCASCPAGSATSDIAIEPNVTSGSPQVAMALRPRILSDDGQAFFSSREALVPEDVNGVQDVYEYDAPTDTLRLLSSGQGSDPVVFADASASGEDVFLMTRQQLLPEDGDELVDVYDAREGSALNAAAAEPEAPHCEADGCQSPPSPAPAEEALGTALSGSGNVKQTRKPHCNRHQRKVRRHGKVRCVKKHARRAHSDRRASR